MATPLVIEYYKAAERPDIELWLEDDDGALIDFSTGYTFEFKIGYPDETAAVTKTTGITGAAGSGNGESPADVPNLVITPTAGEFNVIVPDLYYGQVKATTGGLDRFYLFKIDILGVIL